MTFTARSTKITVGTLFAAAVIVMLVYDKSGTVKLSLCAAVFHEFGHIICLFALSQPPSQIVLGVFGLRISRQAENVLSYKHEVLAALAGPGANLLLASVLCAVALAAGVYAEVRVCVGINVFMALFNLLPVEPLDGGRALVCLLLCRYRHEVVRRVMKIIAAVGIICLTAAGIYILFESGYNFTLLAAAAYLLMARDDTGDLA